MKAVILAAGMSKRMKSDYSKIVHSILGKEIINFLLDSLSEAGFNEQDIIIVCGKNKSEIQGVVKRQVQYAIQEQQLGTADALLSAKEHIKDFTGLLLVVVGDNPYITATEIKRLVALHQENSAVCTFISALFPSTPPPYGRIIRGPHNEVLGVMEEVDATPEQRAIREVNASIYLFNNDIVLPLLFKIDNNNAKKEYYLTDIIHLLKERNHRVEAMIASDYYISIGINNRWELAEAQEKFNAARLQNLALETGVTILQPSTVTIEYDVEIGKDTIIYPSTYIAAGTRIGAHCQIGPFTYLKGVTIPDHQTVRFEKREH